MMPVVTLKRAVTLPLCATFSAWASVTSQWGVSVEGFSRPVTAAVHSDGEPGQGLPAGRASQAPGRDGDGLAVDEAVVGGDLDGDARRARRQRGGQGRGTDQAAQRALRPPTSGTCRGPPNTVPSGGPRTPHHSTAEGAIQRAPSLVKRRNLAAGGCRLI